MKDFNGKLAVVTGGGSGMGREIVRQLTAEGCHVAMCDVSAAGMEETWRLCEADHVPQGAELFSHVADVSDEAQVLAFRDAVAKAYDTDRINLLFNNAGVGRGGSMLVDDRADWDRTFAITWGGVYLCTRAFLPMLVAADEGHIVNTSSVNGFWASVGTERPNTAYAAAKFAVKGFTEALITDLRVNAPHVKCSVVMPGYIGTDMIRNSFRVTAGRDTDMQTPAELAYSRDRLRAQGVDESKLSDEEVVARSLAASDAFREGAPTTAAQAAKIILDGVKADRWRILVGDDAHRLDAAIRANPEGAYEPGFFELFPQPELVGGARR
jgi:NAD(P)-dependent dehydrogenase (short-subunit alcohol dehydrogenase family)